MLKHWKRTLALLGVVAATGLICAAVALGGKKPPAPPPQPQPTVEYSIQVLGPLPGDVVSAASDLNSHGEVVGRSFGGDEPGRAFVYTAADGMVDLNALTGLDLWIASGINDAGQIAASARQGRAYRLTLVRDEEGQIVDAEIVDLGTLPGAVGSRARDINDRGEVVGYAWYEDGSTRAFLYTDADGDGTWEMADIGALVEGSSEAYAINADGWVTGGFRAGASYHAFLYTPDAGMTDLDPELFDTGDSQGFDINVYGHVVGRARTGQKFKGWLTSHAFVYTDAGMIDLGTLGGPNSIAYGINSHGEVVGIADDSKWNGQPFLWTNKTDQVTPSGDPVFAMFNLADLIVDLPQGFAVYSLLGINDAGQICGHGAFVGGPAQAILLTPVSP